MVEGARTDGRTEAAAGPTFAFGKNRLIFLDRLTEQRIGYPFEVARSEEVISFFETSGFLTEKPIADPGGSVNKEYVFSLPGQGAPGRR